MRGMQRSVGRRLASLPSCANNRAHLTVAALAAAVSGCPDTKVCELLCIQAPAWSSGS